jgi:hypothetical protein
MGLVRTDEVDAASETDSSAPSLDVEER